MEVGDRGDEGGHERGDLADPEEQRAGLHRAGHDRRQHRHHGLHSTAGLKARLKEGRVKECWYGLERAVGVGKVRGGMMVEVHSLLAGFLVPENCSVVSVSLCGGISDGFSLCD